MAVRRRAHLFLTAAVVTISAFVLVVPAATADDANPYGTNQNGTTARTNDGKSFVATSTAFVDPDGNRHDVDPQSKHAASPYEYQVHRLAGICPNDPLGQPQDLVLVDRRLVSAGSGA